MNNIIPDFGTIATSASSIMHEHKLANEILNITKRDLFAGMAMMGMLSNPEFFKLLTEQVPIYQHHSFLNNAAIEQADDLMEQLDKHNKITEPLNEQNKNLKEGDNVRYIPTHANGDASHKDCENGIIMRVHPDGKTVYVRYWRNGMLQNTAEATDINDLIKISLSK